MCVRKHWLTIVLKSSVERNGRPVLHARATRAYEFRPVHIGMCTRFVDLFKPSEIDAIVTLCEEAAGPRDTVIMALIQAGWHTGEARRSLAQLAATGATVKVVEAKAQNQKEEMATSEVDKARADTCALRTSVACACGRPVKLKAAVCCDKCPGSHTATCEGRVRDLNRARSEVHSRSAEDGAFVDAGYIILRAPPELEHLRGVHRCSWTRLWGHDLLGGVPPGGGNYSRGDFHIRHAGTKTENLAIWSEAGFRGVCPHGEPLIWRKRR